MVVIVLLDMTPYNVTDLPTFRGKLLHPTSALKMEAGGFSKTRVILYHIIRRHITPGQVGLCKGSALLFL